MLIGSSDDGSGATLRRLRLIWLGRVGGPLPWLTLMLFASFRPGDGMVRFAAWRTANLCVSLPLAVCCPGHACLPTLFWATIYLTNQWFFCLNWIEKARYRFFSTLINFLLAISWQSCVRKRERLERREPPLELERGQDLLRTFYRA